MLELGSVADLISAFATVGALVAAAIAARAAIQTNRQQGIQLRHLEEAENERRLAQDQLDAAAVAFWIAVDPEGRPSVRYNNSSKLPIYDLVVWVAIPEKLLDIHYQSYGPSEGESLRLGSTQRAMESWALSNPTTDWTQLFGAGVLACAACFRDTSNRWWLRDFNGLLSRVSSQAAGRVIVQDAYHAWRVTLDDFDR